MIHLSRTVRYREDASALFVQLGGADRADTVLLESADISTHSGLSSVAILESSLRLTCRGQRVALEPLTASGKVVAARLREELATYLDDATGDLVFPGPEAADAARDEHARLTAPSTVEPLRRLQADPHAFLAGGFAFDYIATFEQLPAVTEGDNGYPDYRFVLAETLLEINHQEHTAELSGTAATEEQAGALRAELDRLAAAIEEGSAGYEAPEPTGGTLTAVASMTDEDYRASVVALQKKIEDGDIYQIVPSRSFRLPCPDAFAAYRELRRSNPSPYMFYLRSPEDELFGASPESNLKFTVSDRALQLYPIAGTRPRGLRPDGTVDHELDIRNELAMRTDHKELAEHVMLVDLARNDLARVAVPGTRQVRGLLQVDRYSRVMHLVSRVTAELAEGLDALDAYRACMNMGTLTGAPKLRATELLREVEGARRGSYGGAVGYLRGGGDMDNCIVIRSAYVRDGVAIVQAGAGVVRDSQPQKEADETLHKASAVLHAVAAAAGATVEVAR